METTPELEELTKHIRRILPDQKALSNLKSNSQARVVEFNWHSRHFVVTPALGVFELKGQNLLITGSSLLIQAALQTKDRNSKVLEGVIKSLQTAEETMRSNRDRALATLEEVKKTMSRLVGKHP